MYITYLGHIHPHPSIHHPQALPTTHLLPNFMSTFYNPLSPIHTAHMNIWGHPRGHKQANNDHSPKKSDSPFLSSSQLPILRSRARRSDAGKHSCSEFMCTSAVRTVSTALPPPILQFFLPPLSPFHACP